ncbi:MAG: PAS domain S-box protein [Rhodocyclaceae bacterium]|nr:PAS domain S-box protein [Rhodocyclaceae bacterium]
MATMSALPSSPAPLPHPHSRRLGWLFTLPGLGIVALVIVVFTLIWVLHRNEVEEQRKTLIADVLWLEQDLRFRMERDEEQLKQLALDLAQKPEGTSLFRERANHLLRNNPELRQVLLLGPGQALLQGLPSVILPGEGKDPAIMANLRRAFDQAQRLGKPVSSEPYLVAPGMGQFLMMQPIFGAEGFSGMVVGVLGMEALLRDAVPWWFAQKYQVRILDDSGTPYASKSNVTGTPSAGLSYDLLLEPPGGATRLSVQANQGTANPLLRLLAGVVIVLGAGVIFSLRILKQQMHSRLRTEQALRAEHGFRKAMEDSLTVGMRARDLSGRVIYVNAAFCRMTGYSRDELENHLPPMPYWAPEDMEETLARHREVLAGEASPNGFEITLMRKSGERFQALIFEAPLIDGEGRQTGWMASFVDITERKRAEELYRQQQEKLQFTSRLITMGEMASTLAHELNQPLSAIASYAAGCVNRIEAGDATAAELKPPLTKLAAQAQRAGQIIRRIHDFVRRSEPRRLPADLNAIIEDALGLVESEVKKRGVRLASHLAPDLPPVAVDRVMVEQLAINLIRNGLDAMGDSPAGEKLLQVETRRTEHELILSVADNGSGIPDDVAAKLFAPFFSTKAEGMGMGLNICRSIAELHHGRLWFESTLPRGTVFHLSLPLESP